MRRLGISIYPEKSTVEEMKAYIAQMADAGCSRIFSCLLSINKPKEAIKEEFMEVNRFAKEKGFEIFVDVSPRVFSTLGISYQDLSFFREIYADGLRLDMGFTGNEEAVMTYNPYGLMIEINMSNDVSAIDTIMDYCPDRYHLCGCHNFYPQEYTGADLESTMEINEHWKEKGVKVALFITSHDKKAHGPWPVHDGLVTIEDHRFMSVSDQVRHVLAMNNVDEILFGNAFATEEEFKQVADVMKEVYVHVDKVTQFGEMISNILPHGDLKRLPLGIELAEGATDTEKEILHYGSHQVSEYIHYMIRSRWTRLFYKNADIPCRDCGKEYFEKGDVLIVNNNLSFYKAEIQICMKPMKNTGQRNLVGHISKDALCILDLIHKGDIFTFNE